MVVVEVVGALLLMVLPRLLVPEVRVKLVVQVALVVVLRLLLQLLSLITAR